MGCSYPAGAERAAALIGRGAELRQLIALIEAMTPGRPCVLVVEGPPGSDRKRLTDELADAGRGLGATVVREPEWTRWTAGRRPGKLLFVCDRPQWLEPRAWAALDVLAESVPVLVILTARTGVEPLPAGRLAAPRVSRIRLAPLSPGEVERLAAVLLRARPGAGLLGLCRVAAGRPGAVRDLIAGLREDGLIRSVDGRAELTSVRLPGRTRSRIADQLAAVSPPARHLLQAATTLRSPFPLVRLTRLLRVSPVVVLPAIDEVLESGLLTGDGEMLTFGHELVRSVVEASMPRPVAAALRDEKSRPPRRRPLRTARISAPGVVEVRRAADWSLLTAREQEVADYVGRALTNRQIAVRLGRSPHTVNFHLRQIFQKLGIRSRVQLASLVRQRETAAVPEPRTPDPSSS